MSEFRKSSGVRKVRGFSNLSAGGFFRFHGSNAEDVPRVFFLLSEVGGLFRRGGVKISLVLKGVDFQDDRRDDTGKRQGEATVVEGMLKADDSRLV